MLNKSNWNKKILFISNHGDMVGGGEYSFLDLLSNLPSTWYPIALVPSQGELGNRLKNISIETHIIPLSTIRPWTLIKVIQTSIQLVHFCKQVKPACIYANGPRAAFYACITKNLF